jgi:hypothetical protein
MSSIYRSMRVLGFCFVSIAALIGSHALSRTTGTESEQIRTNTATVVLGDLREVERIRLSAPRPVMINPDSKCDQRGNVYVAYRETLGDTSNMPFRKLAPDMGPVVQYLLQDIPQYPSKFGLGWDVTPWGVVHALIRGFHHSPPQESELADDLVVTFKDDGTQDGVVKLQQPKEGFVGADRFVAYPGGGFLVTGLVYSDPGERQVKRPFTGVYRQDGQLFREVELTDFLKLASTTQVPGRGEGWKEEGTQGELHKAMWAGMAGKLVASVDGNVYSLRATVPPVIYKISPSGDVLKEIKVHFESSGLALIAMSLPARGGALIEFVHMPTGNKAEDDKYQRILALVDLESGDVIAAYRIPDDGRLMPSACTTPQGQFIFLGANDAGKLDVLKFSGS